MKTYQGNSKVDQFAKQVARTHWRVTELYQGSLDTTSVLQPELVSATLKELGIATEELQVALEELNRQNDDLAVVLQSRDTIRQRYQNVFEAAPDACLLTDTLGVVQEVNQAAVALMGVQRQFFAGKPLVSLVHQDDRHRLRSALSSLREQKQFEISIRLCPRQSEPIPTHLLVDVIHNASGDVDVLRWVMRQTTIAELGESGSWRQKTIEPFHEFFRSRSCQTYCKGEVVSLSPQTICYVTQGIVKLTTLSEHGEDVLVGVAGPSMVFGSSLTSLSTYQAVGLSEVQLVSVPFAEMFGSPQLAQVLLPKINQRLQQAEQFLAMYGQLRVEDRLSRLLTLLGQEIGETCEEGRRLQARLTHQDIASACCSTRVTMTRLLGKLQQEGKVMFDGHNHLILKHWN